MLVRERRKAETRGLLLAAADETFCRSGYHGTTLDDIAASSGFTKGAIYSAFTSKADVFLSVYDKRLEERFQELREVAQLSGDARRRRLGGQWVQRLREERDWQTVLLEFRLHAARDAKLNRRFRERHRRFISTSSGIFAGDKRAIEQEPMARAIVALANGYAMEFLTDPTAVSQAEFADVLSRLSEAMSCDDPPQRLVAQDHKKGDRGRTKPRAR